MVKVEVAWIGWVATHPQFRGRGLGRLATAEATWAGFVLGGKFASLEATMPGPTAMRATTPTCRRALGQSLWVQSLIEGKN